MNEREIEQEIEQEIQDKGKTAPRLTPDHIDAMIKAEDYHGYYGDRMLPYINE